MLVTTKTIREKQFRHLTFEVTRNGVPVKTHTLTINPEDLTQKEPNRSEVTQTLGGAYVEDWGAGLIEMVIRGTTGYRKRVNIQGKETDGFQEFKDLRNDIFRYFLNPDGTAKRDSRDEYTLNFYNWEDSEYYEVFPKYFQLSRSKNRPLLYSYDFPFICLRPIGKSSRPRTRPGEDEGSMVSQIQEGLASQTALINNLVGRYA